VRTFKAAVTRELRIRSLWHSGQFWQSNYYDHIVRNGSDLARIREYIAYNPIAWQFDYENPYRLQNEEHRQQWQLLEDGNST
jgi:hypothetical protein